MYAKKKSGKISPDFEIIQKCEKIHLCGIAPYFLLII